MKPVFVFVVSLLVAASAHGAPAFAKSPTSGQTQSISEFRYVTTAKKRKHSAKYIAEVRKEAIKRSMRYLRKIRPFASNYGRMVAATRAYWRNNLHHPSTNTLTGTIMQHVQPLFRPIVAGEVRAKVASGVAQVKKALR